MEKLRNYDFGVWGDTDTSLIFTAYPLVIGNGPYGTDRIVCDYSEHSSHSLRLTYPANLTEIEHLLGDLWINHYPLTDYDDWLSSIELQKQHPTLIQQFLDLLPENKLEEDK
jgi:hypothetical protein